MKALSIKYGLDVPFDAPVEQVSVGVQQRIEILKALYRDCDILILDEPTSNLDATGTKWYLDQVTHLTDNQLVILGSNQPQEYEFCKNIISVSAFK